MALKAVIDSLADLPKEHRALYREDAENGRFILDVEASEGLELGDLSGAQAECSHLWKELEKRLKRDALRGPLKAAGGSAALLDLHLLPRLSVDRKSFAVTVINEKGRPDFNLKGEDATVGDLVAGFRNNRAFAAAFGSKPPAPMVAHRQPASAT